MKNPFVKTALIGGLAAGVFCFLYLLLLYVIGSNPFGRYKYIYLGLYAIFFGGALWYFRFKQNGGRLSMGRAIGIGLILNSTATLLYGLLLFIWMLIPGTEVISRHKNALVELGKSNVTFIEEQMKVSKELNDEEAYQNLQEQKKEVQEVFEDIKNTELTAGGLAVDQGIGLLFTGMFLTFLTAILFKGK
ncbi:MAG: hypothetical protein CMO01_18000 [Thalassobius sp.]|nr:hypothetical protein [Thalassovita sp.]